MTILRNHNKDCGNNTDKILDAYARKILNEFPGEIIGCEMGIAWGGNVENTGTIWKGRGKYYGFDTFCGMPKHLAVKEEQKTVTIRGHKVVPADCMDGWYTQLGTNELSYEYQRSVLDKLGLDNVILVKGEVNEHSCDDIPYLNFAFLDMDLLDPMKIGYEAVKNKIVPEGYLFLHDVIDNLPALVNWYRDMLQKDGHLWKIVEEIPKSYLAILKRK